MNTTDIRTLEQGQWLFWSIAGPVATLVIGIALMIALKGEAQSWAHVEQRLITTYPGRV
jgi:hypothetical protein